MNPYLRTVDYRISIALAVLVLLCLACSRFELVQASEINPDNKISLKLNFNELELEHQSSDTKELSDRFDEIEEFHLFSYVALNLQVATLLNPTSFKSVYKKRLVFCSARDPPAAHELRSNNV